MTPTRGSKPPAGAPWHTSQRKHIGQVRRCNSPWQGCSRDHALAPRPHDGNARQVRRSQPSMRARSQREAPATCRRRRQRQIARRTSATPARPSPEGDANPQSGAARKSFGKPTRVTPSAQLWSRVQHELRAESVAASHRCEREWCCHRVHLLRHANRSHQVACHQQHR